MIEGVIYLMIYICLLALVVYLVLHVLNVLEIRLPPKVVQIIWLIVALIVVLLIVRLLLDGGGIPRVSWR